MSATLDRGSDVSYIVPMTRTGNLNTVGMTRSGDSFVVSMERNPVSEGDGVTLGGIDVTFGGLDCIF